MATINDFEDLEIWQMAREQCKCLRVHLRKFQLNKEFELLSQVKRSSGSVMDNIAEGFERSGNTEFKNFLSVSKGSNGELRSQIYRAFDYDLLSTEDFNNFVNNNKIIGKKINNFIKYLKTTDIKGFKFHK